MRDTVSFSAASAQARLEAVLDPGTAKPEPHAAGSCAVLSARGTLDGRPVRALVFDRGVAGGSIGAAESGLLAQAFDAARAGSEPVLLIIDSAGARLTEGLGALGAFRRLYRSVLACRASGIPMLALLARNCFGGASMLAFACEARVYSERTLLAVSGPAIIQKLGGAAQLDASSRDAVRSLMGGAARCRHGGEERLVDDTPAAFRAAALAWIAKRRTPYPQQLQARHRTLGTRLRRRGGVFPYPQPGAALPSQVAKRLSAMFPEGFRCALRDGVLWGLAQVNGAEVGVLGLVQGFKVGARSAWLLAEGARAYSRRRPGRPLLMLMDAPGQALTRIDEELILSDYLSHLPQVLYQIGRRHPLTLLITGEAAGAPYVSLAAPARRVLAFPEASLHELPPEAVAQVLGHAEEEDRSPGALLRLAVVDEILSAPKEVSRSERLFSGGRRRGGGTDPVDANHYSLIARCFPEDPDTPVLETDEGGVWTYGDLDRESARYACLLHGLGLQPGDRVAAQVEKSPQALVLYLAALRAGMAFLPLNTAYQTREIEYFLGDAEPGLMVCRPDAKHWIAPLARRAGTPHVLTLDERGGGTLADAVRGQPARFDTVPRAAGDLACIIYTSGTTGRSKGAMISHGNLSSNGLTLRDYWGFTGDDVLIHALPLFHVHGLFVAVHCVLLSGARMIFRRKFDAATAIGDFKRATVLMGVPTFYTRLLAEPGLTREACAGMRLFVSGSAPLLAETHRDFRERTGRAILERYGMSEAGMISSNPLHGERRAGTVGFPLPGITLRVADDQDRPLPVGEVGAIQIKGPNVFLGYWRAPEKTREEFAADGYFRTGDMGVVDRDGYLSIVGRAKDLVITGGYNVYPKEIELLIDEIPGVLESAVIGVPHPDFGEAVAAVVVRDRGGAGLTQESLIGQLKGRLAGYKVPTRVHFVDQLPRNAMGKVQKNELRIRFALAGDRVIK